MLDWLSKSKNPSVSGLNVFGCGYWIDCGCLALLCVSLCPLVPYGNHAQLRGGSDAERVRRMLAYGWVECCRDIAGCRISFASKISILVYFISAIVFI